MMCILLQKPNFEFENRYLIFYYQSQLKISAMNMSIDRYLSRDLIDAM